MRSRLRSLQSVFVIRRYVTITGKMTQLRILRLTFLFFFNRSVRDLQVQQPASGTVTPQSCPAKPRHYRFTDISDAVDGCQFSRKGFARSGVIDDESLQWMARAPGLSYFRTAVSGLEHNFSDEGWH